MFTVPWQKKNKKKKVRLFSHGISEECEGRAGFSINPQSSVFSKKTNMLL